MTQLVQDRRLNLGRRLDEAAMAMHPLVLIRMAIALFGGVIAAMVLGWLTGLGWVAGALAIEAWSWFATRGQARGQATGRWARANFAANYLLLNLWWLSLCGLFWGAGGVAGPASAAIILLSLASVFVLLFHNVPIAFLAAGAAPAIAALSVIALADGRGWLQLLPIWMSLGVGMIFVIGRALDTPSVQDSNRRLKASLSDFQSLAENITDLVTRTDMQGRYLYASPASLTVLGLPPQDLVGTRIQDRLHPDSAPVIRAALGRMQADPAAPQVVTTLIRHGDGRWLWLQTSARLLLEDGVPVGSIGSSRDVTDQMAAETALEAARAEAEAANRIKSEILANLSHEFRTPMNGVLGALHLLEAETLSGDGRQLLRKAMDSGQTLSQLLNDMLDFSRIEAGLLELSPEPTDLGELLRAVIAQLQPEADAKGVGLAFEITGLAPWIEADPVRLRQALLNLVGNGVKFTVQGQVTARLSVAAAASGRRLVRLEIEDTGIGMSPAAQSLLFEQFRQAENGVTRRFGGAGLGLSLTRALAQLMGGEVGFTSLEGQGSTFWLAFEAPAARAAAATPAEPGVLEGVNILLVEDNPTNRLVARTLLMRLGAAVEDAEDGLAGLEAARRGAHDLILMDIQMPNMDGVEAARAIRALPGAPAQVPILALTANVMPYQKAEYLAAGMNGVVAKPISPAALLSEIARLTEESAEAGPAAD
jgi:PAS domain S-box-containing protein